MKSVLLRIVGIALFVISVLLVCYPFISNYLMGLNQDSVIESYQEDIKKLDDKEVAAARKEAEEYNKTLYGTAVLTDPFDPNASVETDYKYESLLNLSGNSVMATVEIPTINVNLPIYHGTSDEVLKKGAGHLQQTSLPIGGKGTHAVITGHTGLSSARLFTDLNLMKADDIFYIHCLNETLAYKVDSIKVVEPEETDDLKIDPEQDYVTLVTCTPYGVNTHRLLVRGVRIPYDEKNPPVIAETRESESTWMREYKKALILGSIIFAVIITAFYTVRIILKKQHAASNAE